MIKEKYYNMQNTIAVICDCDDTLASDTTDFLLKQNGIDTKPFWEEINEMIFLGWDPPLAWMTRILELIKSGKIEHNTNEKLAKLGKEITLYDGVPKFTVQLKQLVADNKDFAKAKIDIEFYIISSGFEDLISGSILSSHFTDIFAGTLAQGSDGKINAIKSCVTFTEKTKFLYAINKGITKKELRAHPFDVNKKIDSAYRRIPFEHMVYIGDSPGDTPCFSAVKGYGGNCIGITSKHTVGKGYELALESRTVGLYPEDYTQGSDLRTKLDGIVKKIGYMIADKHQA